MPNEPSPDDRKKLLKLGILTQEMALLQDQHRKWRIMQRTLVIDLVQREVISQSRASRIAEIGRDTVRSWVNVNPADFKSAQEEADLIIGKQDVEEFDHEPLVIFDDDDPSIVLFNEADEIEDR